MAASSDEILLDLFPLLIIYKDGRVERLTGQDFTLPSSDLKTGVQSKDIIISPGTTLSARLFRPQNSTPARKLPLLVYFHGGGFVVGSPFTSLYHNHLNALVSLADVVAVSVDYGLAPESPIPAAYDDSWRVIEWVASQFAGGEEWIKDHADPNRVYFGGDSAGGNIAHRMAIRAGLETPHGIKLSGIFLNCPFFGGNEVIGDEGRDEFSGSMYLNETLWRVACPGLSGLDEPWINPAKDKNLKRLGCGNVLVYEGGKDCLKDRGWFYKEALLKSGWIGNVEVVEVKGEGHIFSVFAPESENGLAMLKNVASFINTYKCFCGKGAVTMTSWNDDNPGRRFQVCPNLKRNACSFFRWEDPPMCRCSRDIIPGLLGKIHGLESEVERLEGEVKKIKHEVANRARLNRKLIKSAIVMFLIAAIFFSMWRAGNMGTKPLGLRMPY